MANLWHACQRWHAQPSLWACASSLQCRVRYQTSRGTWGQVAPNTGTATWKDTFSCCCLYHQVIQFCCIITSGSSLCQRKQQIIWQCPQRRHKNRKLYHASCSLSTVSNTSGGLIHSINVYECTIMSSVWAEDVSWKDLQPAQKIVNRGA